MATKKSTGSAKEVIETLVKPVYETNLNAIHNNPKRLRSFLGFASQHNELAFQNALILWTQTTGKGYIATKAEWEEKFSRRVLDGEKCVRCFDLDKPGRYTRYFAESQLSSQRKLGASEPADWSLNRKGDMQALHSRLSFVFDFNTNDFPFHSDAEILPSAAKKVFLPICENLISREGAEDPIAATLASELLCARIVGPKYVFTEELIKQIQACEPAAIEELFAEADVYFHTYAEHIEADALETLSQTKEEIARAEKLVAEKLDEAQPKPMYSTDKIMPGISTPYAAALLNTVATKVAADEQLHKVLTNKANKRETVISFPDLRSAVAQAITQIEKQAQISVFNDVDRNAVCEAVFDLVHNDLRFNSSGAVAAKNECSVPSLSDEAQSTVEIASREQMEQAGFNFEGMWAIKRNAAGDEILHRVYIKRDNEPVWLVNIETGKEGQFKVSVANLPADENGLFSSDEFDFSDEVELSNFLMQDVRAKTGISELFARMYIAALPTGEYFSNTVLPSKERERERDEAQEADVLDSNEVVQNDEVVPYDEFAYAEQPEQEIVSLHSVCKTPDTRAAAAILNTVAGDVSSSAAVELIHSDDLTKAEVLESDLFRQYVGKSISSHTHGDYGNAFKNLFEQDIPFAFCSLVYDLAHEDTRLTSDGKIANLKDNADIAGVVFVDEFGTCWETKASESGVFRTWIATRDDVNIEFTQTLYAPELDEFAKENLDNAPTCGFRIVSANSNHTLGSVSGGKSVTTLRKYLAKQLGTFSDVEFLAASVFTSAEASNDTSILEELGFSDSGLEESEAQDATAESTVEEVELSEFCDMSLTELLRWANDLQIAQFTFDEQDSCIIAGSTQPGQVFYRLSIKDGSLIVEGCDGEEVVAATMQTQEAAIRYIRRSIYNYDLPQWDGKTQASSEGELAVSALEDIAGVDQVLIPAQVAAKMPALGTTDEQGNSAIAYLHFVTHNGFADWFITEYDPQTHDAFGMLMGDVATFGLVNIDEIININDFYLESDNSHALYVYRDEAFVPCPLSECVPSEQVQRSMASYEDSIERLGASLDNGGEDYFVYQGKEQTLENDEQMGDATPKENIVRTEAPVQETLDFTFGSEEQTDEGLLLQGERSLSEEHVSPVLEATDSGRSGEAGEEPSLDTRISAEARGSHDGVSDSTRSERTAELRPQPARSARKSLRDVYLRRALDNPLAYSRLDKEFALVDKHARAAANIAAIATLKKIEEENRFATADEQDVLARYVGWGGLQECFDPSKEDWAKEYHELEELLTEEEYTQARRSVLTAYYTPDFIVKAMYSTLENLGFSGGRVLDPAAGVGRIESCMPADMRAASNIHAVEIDSLSARIGSQLNQDVVTRHQGFELFDVAPDSFDVAITNVPFGDIRVADPAYDRLGFLIHDYFFAKSLDTVRPGGVVAFITSKGTMDKRDSKVRHWLAQRADLLGAIRLPEDTFMGEAGTEVVSDILFLQKREEFVENPQDAWIDVTDNAVISTDERFDNQPMNTYFVQHPENVLGDMVVESGPFGARTTCKRAGRDVEMLLSQAALRVRGTIPPAPIAWFDDEPEEEIDIVIADPRARKFSYFRDDAGDIWYRDDKTMRKDAQSTDTRAKRIGQLIDIRDQTYFVLEIQRAGCTDEELVTEQEKLSELYDAWVSKNKPLSHKTTKNLFGADASYGLLCSLEKTVNNEIVKGDIFKTRTLTTASVPTHADTARDALVVCLQQRGCVDIDYICELCGKSADDAITEMGDAIFLSPDGGYLCAGEYLSGDVREKLRLAQALVEAGNDEYRVNVEALMNALPEDIPASDIVIELGASWVPTDIYDEFMYETMSTPFAFRPSGYRQTCLIRYNVELSSFVIDNKNDPELRHSVAAKELYGIQKPGFDGYSLLEDCLNLKDAIVRETVYNPETWKPESIVDKEATALAQQKQDQIRNAFKEWIFADEARTNRLVRLYNDRFNSFVERKYDTGDIIFPNMNSSITLRAHQVNAICRQLYTGNTLLYHVVGAGKTYEMCAAAQEGKRLGLHHKSLFVVPNHITEQVGADYLHLYPEAKILVATSKDFTADRRREFTSRIATGDWDAVIIGHTQFERIPMSQSYQELYWADQYDRMESIIKLEQEESGQRTNMSIKQLEKRKAAIQTTLNRIRAAVDRVKDDGGICFEQLGVDKLFIDEAHYYKNLGLQTRMTRVAGISSTGAKKCDDLLMKINYLNAQTNYKGVVFATGTAVSNSICEMYTLQKYLQPHVLDRLGLGNFDAWISTFGKKVTSMELKPEGNGYRINERFSRFNNIPELMAIFRQVADIKMPEDIPAADLPLPEKVYKDISVERSEYQGEYIDLLSQRADFVRNGKVDPRMDNMLKITHEGRLLALDQRLIGDDEEDESLSKINTAVENVYSIWQKTAEDRLTQLVFCDLATPTGQLAQEKFSVYDDMRNKLVDKGIPRAEIRFVHEATTEKQRADLFEQVRNGEVRILFGSTGKMGTGTNVQDKLCALHHLDCAWRPADMEQRDGRIVRQGNKNDTVEIYRYVTRGTFDQYMFQTVESKQRFISQILSSDPRVRSGEDIDERALSYAEVKALAAGNPLIKEKMELDIKVPQLATLKSTWEKNHETLKNRVTVLLPREIENLKKRVEAAKQDSELAAKTQGKTAEYFAGFTFEDKRFASGAYDPRAVGEYIINTSFDQARRLCAPHLAGEYRGFKVYSKWDRLLNRYSVSLVAAGEWEFSVSADPLGAITRMDNAIARISNAIAEGEDKIAECQANIDSGLPHLDDTFPEQEEYMTLLARQQEVDRTLALDQNAEHILMGEEDEESATVDNVMYFERNQKIVINKAVREGMDTRLISLFAKEDLRSYSMEKAFGMLSGCEPERTLNVVNRFKIDFDDEYQTYIDYSAIFECLKDEITFENYVENDGYDAIVAAHIAKFENNLEKFDCNVEENFDIKRAITPQTSRQFAINVVNLAESARQRYDINFDKRMEDFLAYQSTRLEDSRNNWSLLRNYETGWDTEAFKLSDKLEEPEISRAIGWSAVYAARAALSEGVPASVIQNLVDNFVDKDDLMMNLTKARENQEQQNAKYHDQETYTHTERQTRSSFAR